MTKSDLKTGMVVKTRNGKMYLVMLNPDCEDREFIDFNDDGWLRGSGFNDDLTRNTDYYDNSDYDIVRVYTAGSGICRLFNKIDFLDSLKLLWEREEKPIEMTVSEIEKKLGIKNLKIVKE